MTVIERQHAAALETSFANGSLLCLGHAYPWASPAAPGILIKSLYRGDQTLRISPRMDPRMWGWLLKFLAECPRQRADRHAATRLKLAQYSQEAMRAVVAETGIEFFHTTKGLLYVYRAKRTMEEGVKQMMVLQRHGLDIEVIDAKRVGELEPALEPVRDKLVGAVYVAADGTGDAHIFTQKLAQLASDLGVDFRYGTLVTGLNIQGGRFNAVRTSEGVVRADAAVVAMGSYSSLLLRPLGVKIDVVPVKGYSMTVPISRPEEAPTIGGLDEDNLLAFSVLGDRLRLTATAEFSGYDLSIDHPDFCHMTAAAVDLFPTIGDYGKARLWAGLRPSTPDANPLICPTRIPNLFLNTGHGSMGWTMSCGSGRIAADLVAGREPEIDVRTFRFKG